MSAAGCSSGVTSGSGLFSGTSGSGLVGSSSSSLSCAENLDVVFLVGATGTSARSVNTQSFWLLL